MFDTVTIVFFKWVVSLFHKGGDYIISACRDEVSTRPAETYFTLRLHVEIEFRPGKTGQSFPSGI